MPRAIYWLLPPFMQKCADPFDAIVKPGSVAGACQPSRWTVTLVDVHALEGYARGMERGLFRLLLAPQSYQWSVATIQGAWCIKDYFPSLPFALGERSWFRTPRPAKVLQHKFWFLRQIFFNLSGSGRSGFLRPSSSRLWSASSTFSTGTSSSPAGPLMPQVRNRKWAQASFSYLS